MLEINPIIAISGTPKIKYTKTTNPATLSGGSLRVASIPIQNGLVMSAIISTMRKSLFITKNYTISDLRCIINATATPTKISQSFGVT